MPHSHLPPFEVRDAATAIPSLPSMAAIAPSAHSHRPIIASHKWQVHVVLALALSAATVKLVTFGWVFYPAVRIVVCLVDYRLIV